MMHVQLSSFMQHSLKQLSVHYAAALLAGLLFVIPASYANAEEDEAYLGNYKASLECPGGPIEFELRVLRSFDGLDKFRAKIVNGLAESIDIADVSIDEKGLLIDIAHYDSRIRAKKGPNSNQLIGTWEKRRGQDKWSKLKFKATKIPKSEEADSSETNENHEVLAGKWVVNFAKSEDPAIAIFATGKRTDATRHIDAREKPFISSRKFSGTFLTTTGDYRFLAGSVSKNDKQATLSCFDGGHAFLFKMELQTDGTLNGDFWSSDSWHETWTAVRDENAKLPDAFAQTKLLESNINSLSFPDINGKMTSLGDEKFAGDARLIYVFGSWCPNCHDAAAYFSELQLRYAKRNFSITGLAFELTDDQERNAKQIKKYLARHGCDYPVLVAGPADKKLATKAFPVLDRVRSYPTTLFVDRKGNVKAVHTGFTGPATGEAFEELKTKFESQIQKLLDEK